MAHLIRALRGTEACHGAEGARAGERSYLAHERTVMAMLASRHRDLDPDSRYEIYHEAWASVLERRAEGVEIEHLEGYLLCAADRLASKRVHGADARRRITFDPVESPFASVADPAQSPEEAVLAADEARRVRMLIDELEGSERRCSSCVWTSASSRPRSASGSTSPTANTGESQSVQERRSWRSSWPSTPARGHSERGASWALNASAIGTGDPDLLMAGQRLQLR